MSEFPSVAEELDRKVLEELENVMHKYAQFAILPREAYLRVNVLWEIAAGLVPRETMELIAAASNELKRAGAGSEPLRLTSTLVNGAGQSVQLILKGDRVILRPDNKPGQDKDYSPPGEVTDTYRWAAHKFTELSKALTAGGYKKLN